MSTMTLTIKKKSLKQKLSRIARDRFGGDEEKAASQILEKALQTERVVGKANVEDIKKHPAFGMWKDRKDIEDSVTFVNKMRAERSRRRRARYESR